MSKMHELKAHPEEYEALVKKKRSYDVRRNDRGFVVDDVLHLKEWDPATETYSGRETYARIVHMTHGGTFGLPSDICVLGLDVRVSVGAFPAVKSKRSSRPPKMK